MLRKINPEFNKISINGPREAVCVARAALLDEDKIDQEKEHLFAIGLDSDRRIKFLDLVCLGTMTTVSAHPRELFRRAVIEGAHSLVILHNHPTRDLIPSKNDIKFTQRCIAAGKILGIEMAQSLIFSAESNDYFKIPKNLPGAVRLIDISQP